MRSKEEHQNMIMDTSEVMSEANQGDKTRKRWKCDMLEFIGTYTSGYVNNRTSLMLLLMWQDATLMENQTHMAGSRLLAASLSDM
jgi:hypothetical protein